MSYDYTYTKNGQLKFYNRIVRSVFALSEDQRTTLLFVLDRTIGWRKIWECISIKEFENGMFRRRKGRRILVARGTGLSAERVGIALEDLRQLGAIEVENLGTKVFYRIAEDWCDPELPQAGSLQMWRLNESDYTYGNDKDDEA